MFFRGLKLELIPSVVLHVCERRIVWAAMHLFPRWFLNQAFEITLRFCPKCLPIYIYTHLSNVSGSVQRNSFLRLKQKFRSGFTTAPEIESESEEMCALITWLYVRIACTQARGLAEIRPLNVRLVFLGASNLFAVKKCSHESADN